MRRLLSPEESEARLRAPRCLRSHGIPCVLWFEDAVQHYGVPTALFDLYLVVPDIEVSAKVLEAQGWKRVKQELGRIMNSDVKSPQARLRPPTEGNYDPEVVLLPAEVWSADFATHKGRYSVLDDDAFFYPSLPSLVNGFIDVLLGGPDELRRPVSVNTSYLYHYVPQMKERAFANHLRRDNQQYHHDVISGMRLGTIPFLQHAKKVREEIRSGKREISEASASDQENPRLYFGMMPGMPRSTESAAPPPPASPSSHPCPSSPGPSPSIADKSASPVNHDSLALAA